MLEESGHEVITVQNGQEMMELVINSFEDDKGFFDVILTDVQMPIMDGLTATERIRDYERRCKIPNPVNIVAVTAHAMPEEKMKMLAIGVNDVITKPIDTAKLASVLQTVCTSKESSTYQPQVVSANSQIEATTIIEADSELMNMVGNEASRLAGQDKSNFVFLKETNSIIDIEDVLKRTGDSHKRTLMIIRAFIASFEEQKALLVKAADEQNYTEIKFISHTMKGLLLDVGAKSHAGMAGDIELLCANGNYSSVLELVKNLTEESEVITTAVHKAEESLQQFV